MEEKQIGDAVIALPQMAYGQVNKLVLTLHDLPVEVRVVPDYFSLALYRAQAEDFGGLPMIYLRDPALSEFQRLVKRLFDLLVGTVCVLISLPLLGLIASLIKLDSPGLVIFRQKRVGENSCIFRIYKFRTMVVGAEKMQAHQLSDLDLLDFQPFERMPDVLGSADVLVAILEPDAGIYSAPSKVLTYLCAERALLLAIPPENLSAHIVSEHFAGLVVPPQHTLSFLEAADRLLADAELRQTFAGNGRAYAENTFNIAHIGDLFERIILGQNAI